MGTIAITGSASGIGRATRAWLEAGGHAVIGIDRRDAEVVADLGTAGGRAAAVERVGDRCGGRLDGLVAAAGITGDDGPAVVSVDYFGAVATLAGLRPFLARATAEPGDGAGSPGAGPAGEGPAGVGPAGVGRAGAGPRGAAAVAIASNSSTTQPGLPLDLVERCLAGDEAGARSAARDGIAAYGAAKLALARWVRRLAVAPGWAGAGVRLNAISPGFVDTPLTAGGWDFVASIADIYPVPLGRPGRADEIAAIAAFLLSPDAGFFCGAVLTPDGGTEAAVRADDWPAARP